MEFSHESVLLKETIDGLNIKPDGIYVDGTLGGGGHSFAICERLAQQEGSIICIDRDASALSAAGKRLSGFGEMVKVVRSNYADLESVLKELRIDKVDGIVLDLGVSSYQLDTADRGFSYREDGPLDMRMDNRQVLTAKAIVNTYGEMDLTRIIRDYGEEKFAKQISRKICEQREIRSIATTFELVEIIKSAMPMKVLRGVGHPAKKTFQAIRIECNQELEALKNSLNVMIEVLNPKGRLCVITFHSLEDRIVKNAFRINENPCTCPRDFPVCVCGKKSKGRIITRKPIVPSDGEIERNRRAKSAKLRIFERA
ncbi:MAG: 16S rRNA (cytosine(1402)-N(4))-methyltransferase RsmH [Lachnospiraceae bacterium]|jgi:16S rRNA (cytosine1402-N4)-methyltransferase|nr:16S rRNA (cytosine(1402)-N(4))-methyltransferase RsmH [Lachnospiraceae bacterium]